MPKIVDHDQRRREVAEVVLALVARKGVAGVTLNDVAAESGWSRGVLTHYFGTRGELVEAGLRHGMRTISSNIATEAANNEPRAALLGVLEEILPLDDRRLAFARVYVSYLAEAMVVEQFQEYFDYNHQAWRDLLASVITRGRDSGHFTPIDTPAGTADALAAVTEGIRMRALFAADLTPDRQRALLARWVDHLVGRVP